MKRKDKYSSEESPLTHEELEMLKKSVSSGEDRSKLPPHDTSEKAKVIRFIKKEPLLIVAAVIISLAILTGVGFGVAFGIRAIVKKQNQTRDYTVYLGTESYTVDYVDARIDDVLFIDMRKIAKFAGLVISGSKEKIKFTADSENYLRFENKSEFAVINGAKVAMTSTAVVNENECLIPFSFLQKTVLQGLKIRLDTQTNTIKITKQLYSDTKEPADILFTNDGFSIIQSITQLKKEEIGLDSYNIDITPYLSYIDPDNASEFLVLANKKNPLGENYNPTKLTTLQSDLNIPSKNDSLQLCESAAYALKAMLEAMVADGVDGAYLEGTDKPSDPLFVTSAYRSYKYQKDLYNKYVFDYMSAGMTEEEAKAEASRTSARPGESEHQTGLCFDFITDSMSGKLDERFENTPAFDWLKDNAHLFGFILRYPKGEDKINITGYDYEPWHYRFVGREAAVEMYRSGLTLEEYLELN